MNDFPITLSGNTEHATTQHQTIHQLLNVRSRRYRIVATNDKTGHRTVACPGPFTHAEACTALAKFNPARNVRIYLEEIGA